MSRRMCRSVTQALIALVGPDASTFYSALKNIVDESEEAILLLARHGCLSEFQCVEIDVR